MGDKPLISVVIPTRNAASTLQKVIESVVHQQHVKVEILVVDYLSTDNTVQIASNYPQVRLFNETTQGIYQAMNKGIREARGEWLYFIGADDVMYDPSVFKKIFENNIPAETELILGNVENVGVAHALVKTVYTNKYSRGIFWRNTLHHQGVLYHKNVFNTYQYNTRYSTLADYEINLRLFLAKTKAFHSELFFAKSYAGGISKQFTHALYDEELAIKNELLPFFPKIFNWGLIALKRRLKIKKE
jgi:putative colanic acid biosynthesis glycosyltransferase